MLESEPRTRHAGKAETRVRQSRGGNWHLPETARKPIASDRRCGKRAEKSAARLPKCRVDPAFDRVLKLVAQHERVSTAQLLHPSRCRAPIARARQLAMYLMHTMLGRTMSDVGSYFGRDRTTVAHACRLVEDARDDAGFDDAVAGLEASITLVDRPTAGREAGCDE